MECIPAIDLRDGRCVRLLRGDFDAETNYGDPVPVARAYAEAGAAALHIVDLDAARSGRPVNRDVVLAVAAAAGIPVQLGGGMRDEDAVAGALEAGIDRVVVGTFAVDSPERVAALARHFAGRIVLGLDHRPSLVDGLVRRAVAVRGWEAGGGIELEDALAHFAGVPFAGLLVTDISRDGTLEGPDLEGYRAILRLSDRPLIASGGIGTLAHLRALAELDVSGRRVASVVIGKALLAGAFTLAEAVLACGS